MYCSKCGNELIENAAFCSNCGEMVKSTNTKKKKVEKKVEKKESIKEEVNNSEEIELQKASQGKRFVDFIIDYVVVGRLVIPFMVGLLFPYGDEVTWYVANIIFVILYFFIFEHFTGKTLGKVITRTKVLNLLDEKPTAGQILIRTLCRFIPFEPFSYLSTRPVGWHDTLSKTYVAEKSSN